MVYSIYVIYIRCGCGLGLVCIYIYIYIYTYTHYALSHTLLIVFKILKVEGSM